MCIYTGSCVLHAMLMHFLLRLCMRCYLPQVESLKAARAEAKGNAYFEYTLDKQLAYVSDPSNIAFEELELPQLIQVRTSGVQDWPELAA